MEGDGIRNKKRDCKAPREGRERSVKNRGEERGKINGGGETKMQRVGGERGTVRQGKREEKRMGQMRVLLLLPDVLASCCTSS